MREILFRGKRIDSEEWAYGFFTIASDEEKVTGAYIFPSIPGCFIEVEPKTVGQYTRLTDKNGIGIFEGDIVKVHDLSLQHNDFIGKVEFSDASFVISEFNMVHYKWINYEVEVISNIFDF